LREFGARDSSAAGGVFAAFDVHRAAGENAEQARAAKRPRVRRGDDGFMITAKLKSTPSFPAHFRHQSCFD